MMMRVMMMRWKKMVFIPMIEPASLVCRCTVHMCVCVRAYVSSIHMLVHMLVAVDPHPCFLADQQVRILGRGVVMLSMQPC